MCTTIMATVTIVLTYWVLWTAPFRLPASTTATNAYWAPPSGYITFWSLARMTVVISLWTQHGSDFSYLRGKM
jgi:hypothetical protein